MPVSLASVALPSISAVLVLVGLTGSAVAQPLPGAVAHPSSTASTRIAGSRTVDAKLSNEQFAKEQDARAHCPTGTVVWANMSSKAYHLAGTKFYGKTKHGAFMCQADADHDAFHTVKGEMPDKTTK